MQMMIANDLTAPIYRRGKSSAGRSLTMLLIFVILKYSLRQQASATDLFMIVKLCRYGGSRERARRGCPKLAQKEAMSSCLHVGLALNLSL